MTFPTGTTISTANVDSDTDDPSLARIDIYNSFVALNSIISSANTAQGVLVLDASGKVAGTYLPANYSSTSGAITLSPANGIVNITRVLRLAQITTSDLGTLTGTTSPQGGDLAFLTDGDAGQPCLAVYNGSNWKVVRLSMTVGDVGATISITTSFTATAD